MIRWIAGLILMSVVAGMSGGIGAVWLLSSQKKQGCGFDVVCYLAKLLNMNGASNVSVSVCLGEPEREAIAKLGLVLYAPSPPDDASLGLAMREAMKAEGECPSLNKLIAAACRELNGANSGNAEACANLITVPPAQ